MDRYSTSYDSSYGRHEPMEIGSDRLQKQRQVSLEATKEKIYMIHGNLINILEELEDRIQAKQGRYPMPKSNTEYYDHRVKCDDTVDEVLQGQLLTFEMVMKGCDQRVKRDLKKDLEKATTNWIALRQAKKLPKDIVDMYAERTLEIITRGKTSHAKEFLESKSKHYSKFGNEDAQMLMDSTYKASEIDKKFQNDPSLKAKAPEIRAIDRNEDHFVSISGYKENILVIVSDGTVLTFKDVKGVQNWKVLLEPKEDDLATSFTQIYELPGKNEVLAIDKYGELFHSDRNLKDWKPVMKEGKAVLKLIVGSKAVIAVDQQNEFWDLNNTEPLIWKKMEHFKVLDRMTDVSMGMDAMIWTVGPEKDIASWDQSNIWYPQKTPSGVSFEKIYANPWNEQVWAVDTGGVVYFRESEKNPAWNKDRRAPKVQSLAIIDHGVVGQDISNDLWIRRFPDQQGNWEKLDSLPDIRCDLRLKNLPSGTAS